jgi:hypothetical protein
MVSRQSSARIVSWLVFAGALDSPVHADAASAPASAHSLQEIRQHARDLDTYLDLSVSLTADFLDDVEYLQKDPDMPEAERAAFSAVWPNERAVEAVGRAAPGP